MSARRVGDFLKSLNAVGVAALSKEAVAALRCASVQDALIKQEVSVIASGAKDFAEQAHRESHAIAELAKRIESDVQQ